MKTMPPMNENEEVDASSEELDRMLKVALREPEGISARIRAAVHQGREIQESTPRFRVWRWWASAAAVLLIVAGFALPAVVRKAPAGGQSATAMEETSPGNETPSVEQPAVGTDADKADYSSGTVSVASSVPQAVRLAGVNAGGKISSAENGVHEVMPVVFHRWMVKDIAEASAILEEYAKAHKLHSVTVDKEEASFGFRLSDKELQELVDWLHAGKWRLLSTQYPLPERGREVRFSGADVQYVMDLRLAP